MRKLLAIAGVAAAAAIAPTTALAGSFTGVVVGKGSGSLAVASRTGAIRTVHTRTHARIGARIRVNGDVVRVTGFARRVRIHAVVVRRQGGTTFLAGGRSLFDVHMGGRRLAALATSSGTGSIVNTTAAITSKGMLVAGSLKVVGDESSVQVQALVTTIGDGTVTVTVNGTPLTIPVPPGIQLDPSLVGQTISLTLDLSGDDAEAVEADDQGEPNDQAGDANDQADANDNEQADDNDQADESGDSTEAGDDGQSAGDQSGSGDQGNNAGDDGGDNGGGDDGGGD